MGRKKSVSASNGDETTVESGSVATESSPKAPPLTKRERFLKLAPARTQQVLTAIARLRNCSNRASYEYTAEEVDKIMSHVNTACQLLTDCWTSKEQKSAAFSL